MICKHCQGAALPNVLLDEFNRCDDCKLWAHKVSGEFVSNEELLDAITRTILGIDSAIDQGRARIQQLVDMERTL